MNGVLQAFVTHYGYVVFVILLLIGLYIVVAHGNLVKKLIGLSIFQGAVFVLFILFAAVRDGAPPILDDAVANAYANPLPHVLILTAIVVSIATTALGLALTVRVNDAWGTIEEHKLPPAFDESTDPSQDLLD